MNRLTLCAALAVCLLSGCKLLEKNPDDPPPPPPTPVEAECYALEFDASGKETTRARPRDHDGVRFNYLPMPTLEAELARKRPERLFVVIHGWNNDTRSARAFTSQFVKPLAKRAKAAGAKAMFLGVHWDSEEVNFFGSAETAEKIGRRRVAALLTNLGPLAKNVVVIGHSLGGRLTLSALQGRPDSGQERVAVAVLLQAAVSSSAFVAGSENSFPGAPSRASLIINVHSEHDNVLGVTYPAAMSEPAIGYEGARMPNGDPFPTIAINAGGHDRHKLQVGIENQADAPYGGPVMNVHASAIVDSHSDLTDPPLLDLIWEAAYPAAK